MVTLYHIYPKLRNSSFPKPQSLLLLLHISTCFLMKTSTLLRNYITRCVWITDNEFSCYIKQYFIYGCLWCLGIYCLHGSFSIFCSNTLNVQFVSYIFNFLPNTLNMLFQWYILFPAPIITTYTFSVWFAWHIFLLLVTIL